MGDDVDFAGGGKGGVTTAPETVGSIAFAGDGFYHALAVVRGHEVGDLGGGRNETRHGGKRQRRKGIWDEQGGREGGKVTRAGRGRGEPGTYVDENVVGELSNIGDGLLESYVIKIEDIVKFVFKVLFLLFLCLRFERRSPLDREELWNAPDRKTNRSANVSYRARERKRG
jgi:hypothetical protein